MMLQKASLSLFLLFTGAVSSTYAQGPGGICGETPPTAFMIKGRVIAPGADFDRYHEVLQYDESRLVGFGYTNSTGEYRLPEQPAGYYYLTIRIDGFKEYKEKITVDGCDRFIDHFVYLEWDDEVILPVILDFTGEVNEVVDVAELKRVFPRKAVTEFERAKEERLNDQPQKARARLEKLLAEYPDFYDAHNALGSVYLEMKRFRDAERHYNEARKLRPNSAAPLVSLGSLYVQEAEASLAPQPGLAGVVLPGGDLAIILDDARSVLADALKLKPDAAYAYYLVGVAEMRGNRYSVSETNLLRAIELEPKLRWSRIALGNLYVKQKRLKEALAQFDAYLAEFKKVSNRPEVQEVRGKIAAELSKGSSK